VAHAVGALDSQADLPGPHGTQLAHKCFFTKDGVAIADALKSTGDPAQVLRNQGLAVLHLHLDHRKLLQGLELFRLRRPALALAHEGDPRPLGGISRRCD